MVVEPASESYKKVPIVIVPAYNEAENIGAVLEKVKQEMPTAAVIVIDDGSTDRTADIVKERGVKVVSLPVNLGIGGAVQTGFKYAYENGYDIAVQIDGDGQHNASEVEKLIVPIINQEADVVKGSRYLGEPSYNAPLMRRTGMVLFAKVASLTLGQRITDTTSGFWAVNRKALKLLVDNYPTDYPDADNIIYLGLSGLRVTEIPVKMQPRLSGDSTINTLNSIYYPFRMLLSILSTFLNYLIQRRA